LLSIGLSIILVTGTALANNTSECDVEPLLKGEAAPCDGYLFSYPVEQWMREDREYDKKLLENYKEQNNILRQITINQDSALQSHKELEQQLMAEVEARRKANQYWGIGGFVLGAVATALIVKQVK